MPDETDRIFTFILPHPGGDKQYEFFIYMARSDNVGILLRRKNGSIYSFLHFPQSLIKDIIIALLKTDAALRQEVDTHDKDGDHFDSSLYEELIAGDPYFKDFIEGRVLDGKPGSFHRFKTLKGIDLADNYPVVEKKSQDK